VAVVADRQAAGALRLRELPERDAGRLERLSPNDLGGRARPRPPEPCRGSRPGPVTQRLLRLFQVNVRAAFVYAAPGATSPIDLWLGSITRRPRPLRASGRPVPPGRSREPFLPCRACRRSERQPVAKLPVEGRDLRLPQQTVMIPGEPVEGDAAGEDALPDREARLAVGALAQWPSGSFFGFLDPARSG
jgi:hypothetical protein